MLPSRWLIFLNPTFIFYDPEVELQKACVLLAEECSQLGSMVHWLASFVGMLLAVIPTVCIFSAPLFLDLPRYFDTFFMEDLGSLFHHRVFFFRKIWRFWILKTFDDSRPYWKWTLSDKNLSELSSLNWLSFVWYAEQTADNDYWEFSNWPIENILLAKADYWLKLQSTTYISIFQQKICSFGLWPLLPPPSPVQCLIRDSLRWRMLQ